MNQPAIPAGPAPAVPKYTADYLTEAYTKLRDKKKELEAQHKQALAPFNEAMALIENELQTLLVGQNAKSVATTYGTAYQTTRNSITVSDPAAFREWAIQTGHTHLFENRVSKEAVENYVQQAGSLPPGLTLNSQTTVQIRKS